VIGEVWRAGKVSLESRGARSTGAVEGLFFPEGCGAV